MGLKIVIVILFIGVVISLFTGLRFMVTDQGDSKKRQWYALSARIILTASLLGTIAYGIQSGKLKFGAPWDVYKYESLESPEQ